MSFQSLQKDSYGLTQKEVRKLRFEVLRGYKSSLKKIEAQLNKVYAEILQGVEPEKYYNTMLKRNRLEKLFREIEEIYLAQAQVMNATMAESSELAFTNQFYRQQYISAWFVPVAGASLDFYFIDNLAVEMSVYGTEAKWNELRKQAIEEENRKKRKQKKDRVKKLSAYRIEGERPTLKKLLLKKDKKALREIKETITQGLITGQSNQSMSVLLRKKYAQFGRNADRIIRTETNRNLNAGQMLNTQEAKDRGVKARRMVLSTLDARTRTQSGRVDSRMENDKGYFKYPRGIMVRYPGNSGIAGWDINDRETTITTINGVKPKARAGINPVTGETEVADFYTFSHWMKKHNLTRNKSGKIIKKEN